MNAIPRCGDKYCISSYSLANRSGRAADLSRQVKNSRACYEFFVTNVMSCRKSGDIPVGAAMRRSLEETGEYPVVRRALSGRPGGSRRGDTDRYGSLLEITCSRQLIFTSDITTMSISCPRDQRLVLGIIAVVWLVVAGFLLIQAWPDLPHSLLQWALFVGLGPPLYVLGEGLFAWVFSPAHGKAVSDRTCSVRRMAVALPIVLGVFALGWLLSWLVSRP